MVGSQKEAKMVAVDSDPLKDDSPSLKLKIDVIGTRDEIGPIKAVINQHGLVPASQRPT